MVLLVIDDQIDDAVGQIITAECTQPASFALSPFSNRLKDIAGLFMKRDQKLFPEDQATLSYVGYLKDHVLSSSIDL